MLNAMDDDETTGPFEFSADEEKQMRADRAQQQASPLDTAETQSQVGADWNLVQRPGLKTQGPFSPNDVRKAVYGYGPYPVNYPTSEDAARARANNLEYGSPAASFGKKNVKSQVAPLSEVANSFNESRPLRTKSQYQTVEAGEVMYRDWLAARRSPTSSLGFSPFKTAYTDNPTGRLNIGGMYDPKSEDDPRRSPIWFDLNNPSSQVHESMHRGINLLRRAGKLPFPVSQHEDEMLVRALMLRHFGDVEKQPGMLRHPQIDEAARTITDKQLDDLENAAADYLAEKRPMGPR
jgi:hypothetical protein